MTTLTILVGALLTIAGIVAYLGTESASVTALIPSVVGLVLLVLGWLGSTRQAWRRHSMHVALAVALVGIVGSLMNVVKIGEVLDGTAERPTAVIVSTVMFVVLIGYVILGIRSFVNARRIRNGSSGI